MPRWKPEYIEGVDIEEKKRAIKKLALKAHEIAERLDRPTEDVAYEWWQLEDQWVVDKEAEELVDKVFSYYFDGKVDDIQTNPQQFLTPAMDKIVIDLTKITRTISGDIIVSVEKQSKEKLKEEVL